MLLTHIRIIASSTSANCTEWSIKRATVVSNSVVTLFGVLSVFGFTFSTNLQKLADLIRSYLLLLNLLLSTFTYLINRSIRLDDHERAHVYQYMVLGPLYLPVYLLCGGVSARNPFERAADCFARFGRGWWP